MNVNTSGENLSQLSELHGKHARERTVRLKSWRMVESRSIRIGVESLQPNREQVQESGQLANEIKDKRMHPF
jgi:hypothetical protein